MVIKLKKTEAQSISEFSNNVAVGLMISAILTQIPSQKLGSIIFSLVFLYFSVKLRIKI
ncbi:MAG: hypothetical protein AAB778_03175 [Patescibacteria group bacterium]